MTCLIERTQVGYRAYIVDLPGCVSEATTLDEAVRHVRQRLIRYLEGNPDSLPIVFTAGGNQWSASAVVPVDPP